MYFSEISIIVGCGSKIIDFFNNPNNEAEEAAQKTLFVSGNNPAFARREMLPWLVNQGKKEEKSCKDVSIKTVRHKQPPFKGEMQK